MPRARTALGVWLVLDLALELGALIWHYDMNLTMLCEAEMAWAGCGFVDEDQAEAGAAAALTGSASFGAAEEASALPLLEPEPEPAVLGSGDTVGDLVVLAGIRLLVLSPILCCRIRWAMEAAGFALACIFYLAFKAAAVYGGDWTFSTVMLFALGGAGAAIDAIAFYLLRHSMLQAAGLDAAARREVEGEGVHWTRARGRAAGARPSSLGARITEAYEDWRWNRTLLRAAERLEKRSRGAGL
jgi:hypothetical protein